MFNASNVKESLVTMGKFKSHWFRDSDGKLRTSNMELNFAKFKHDRDMYIKRLNGIYQRNLDGSGVDHIQGHAKFLDNNTLEVGNETFQAEHICIASGSKPHVLDIPGKEHVITSDGFFDLEEIPKRTLVVGGGYIGKYRPKERYFHCFKSSLAL